MSLLDAQYECAEKNVFMNMYNAPKNLNQLCELKELMTYLYNFLKMGRERRN